MTLSFEAVQYLADQLPPLDQARLIEHLARRLAHAAIPQASISPPPSIPDAWARLFAISDDIGATYPEAHLAARLEADRHERDSAVRGRETDVYP